MGSIAIPGACNRRRVDGVNDKFISKRKSVDPVSFKLTNKATFKNSNVGESFTSLFSVNDLPSNI